MRRRWGTVYEEDPEYKCSRKRSTSRTRTQSSPQPTTSTTSRGRPSGSRLNSTPAASPCPRELNVTSNLHNVDVPNSFRFRETTSLVQTTNHLEAERVVGCTSPSTRQHIDKNPNLNADMQIFQNMIGTNNLLSFEEVAIRNNSALNLLVEDGNRGFADQGARSSLNSSKSNLESNGDDIRIGHPLNVAVAEDSCSDCLHLGQILNSIVNKYGDISKECYESRHMQTTLLDGICHLIKELGSKKLNELDHDRLHDIDLFLESAEKMKFNVGWLRLRVGDLLAGVKSYNDMKIIVSEHNGCMKCIEKMKNDLEKRKADLEALKLEIEQMEKKLICETPKAERLRKKINDFTSRYQCFLSKSVMDGLL